MAKQPQPDFSPEELQQVQQHGKALLGEPTDFDEAVESHLADHYPKEFSAKKMRTAQMGLAPSPMESAQVKQQGALQQAAATQGAQQAQQAQAGMLQTPPPQAPAGPQGVTTPYPAQVGQAGGSGTPPPPAPAPQQPEDQEGS